MFGYIYKTTNIINNKIYIGQHRHSEFDTQYYGSGKLLIEAIKKYGIENFKCELLEECESEEELNSKEIYYIDLFKSTTKNNNYNISDGGFVPRLTGTANGNFGKHRPRTLEEKYHLSLVTKGHKPTFTGKHTEETKQKIGLKSHINNLNRDKSVYMKVSQSALGNKMMHKDNVCIRVHPEKFDYYLNDGWVFGGLSRKGKYKNRHQSKPLNFTTKDKVAIHNDLLNKFVPKAQLNIYLEQGWALGLKKRVN